jgi:hypothetical protein
MIFGASFIFIDILTHTASDEIFTDEVRILSSRI